MRVLPPPSSVCLSDIPADMRPPLTGGRYHRKRVSDSVLIYLPSMGESDETNL